CQGGQRVALCAALSFQLKVNSSILFILLINRINRLLKVFYKKWGSSQPLQAACLPSKPDWQFSRIDDPASSVREAVMAVQ
ncbi:TPA: hypothetical protein ACGWUS_003973, partial [Pseudomonas aeruginosa]